ncbi:hypothetical protein QFZ37_001978 [Chryseobacterium ginsenosidimutans]|nr:hypothetical protein [Chryseobacterium ginsenosidimutans]
MVRKSTANNNYSSILNFGGNLAEPILLTQNGLKY